MTKMKIYTNNAKINVTLQVGEDVVTFVLKPLTQGQKLDLMGMYGESAAEQVNMVVECLRLCLVQVKGLTDENDEEWNVSIQEGKVTTESLDVIMNIPPLSPICVVAMQLLQGLPSNGKVKGPDGKELKGVTVKLGNGS